MVDYLELLSGAAEEFIERVWGRRILVHQADPAQLEEILSIQQADHLITRTALRTPQIRMAKSGSVLPESDYTKHASIGGRPMTGLVDPVKAMNLFSDGATIVFQGLHRYWEPLTALVRGLEEDLGHPCQANAYLTPPGSQGFALHADSHDVFVFQTFGVKEWEVHDEEGAHQVMMEPGTSMYLPTGTPHAARTQATASLHVTVGINQVTWRDLLRRLIDNALAAEVFDGPLPAAPYVHPERTAAALAAKLSELAAKITEVEVAGFLADREASFHSSRQPLIGGGLQDRLAVLGLGPGTLLRRRAGSSCRIRVNGDQLLLLLGDRRLSVPARVETAVEWVVDQVGEFTPADVPGLADESSALVLCRRLVREGLLEIRG